MYLSFLFLKMKEPIEPAKEDCCNSGCNPCIFDVYEKQLLLYRKYQENDDVLEKALRENAISQLTYTEFIVVDNINVCPEHQLIILKVKPNNHQRIKWQPGSHFLVKYTSGDYSCSRAYTPLKKRVKSIAEFSILVKRYSQGIVSQYLCDLKPCEITLWRGPYSNYDISPNKFDRIIMIAQGTGIAPFYSIIENVLGNEEDMTKLILFYCCQSKEFILFREELYSWKGYWNFTYTVYISNSSKDDIYKYQEPIRNHKLDTVSLLHLMPFSMKDQILLCGSAKFMDYYNDFFKSEHCENIVLF